MKKLMFSVAGAAALMAISGCMQTGPLKGPDGKNLTTAGGAMIVIVVDGNCRNDPPTVAKNDDDYKTRLAIAEANKTRPVNVAKSDYEVAKGIQANVLRNLISTIRSAAGGGDFKRLTEHVKYEGGRPVVEENTLKRSAGRPISKGVIVVLRALIEKDLTAFLEKEIYPKIVTVTVAKVRPAVERCVSAGEFANARELIWTASTRGVLQVDEKVRKQMMEVMHGLVNPTDWKALVKKIEAEFQSAMDAKAYDEGVAKLKKLEADSHVKEYSVFIDKKISAIKAELSSLGIPEKDMEPILAKQGALIAEAANIKDVEDRMITLADAREEAREIQARKDPLLAEYYRRLDDFHDTLIKYNCTKKNADRIATGLDEDLIALITLLRKPAVFETNSEGEKTALMLGTRSLNDRIHNLVADRCEKLIMARDAAIRAAYLAKLKAAKDELEAKVRALVSEGKYEEARELIWNAAATGDLMWDADMFELGVSLLRTLVNPADWERIEADIRANFKRLRDSGDFEALKKFLGEYPMIRQHTVKLDEQLAKVKAEAEALGADPEAAAAAARAACNMVTEAEALVDHFDQVVSSAAKIGEKVDKAKLEAELVAYAEKLSTYHATPENVALIVGKLRAALNNLIAEPTNPAATRLELGTNAVNDRIKRLIAELLQSLEDEKRKWQDEEIVRVTSDLEKRVRKAVKEERFTDARNYIRDTKLIGRKDLDLQIYELRVGLLDSCVNPVQLDYLLAEIDAKVQALVAKKDYAGLVEYLQTYPYVHDQYVKIEAALEAVKNAMIAIEISAAESERDEKIRFFSSIEELLEKRRESWKPERDLSGIEKALTEVAKAMFEHLNKHPELVDLEKNSERLHILADIAALDRTITTWELNEALRQRIAEYLPMALKQLAIAQYAELLTAIDAEVSFDSQIAMAEEAISRQLGIKCDKASFKVNALLGEYARVFRLMKKGVKVSKEQATTMLLGGAYLDQAQVISRAIELGAEIDGVSDRDPLGRTALALAIDAGHSALVKQLVQAGASLDATDKDGNAIIHYAAKSGNLSVLKVVTAGAPVVVKNNKGSTPLMIAVTRNQPAVVEFLVAAVPEDKRAEFVNCTNNDEDTAFDVAAKFGSRDVLDALAGAGAEFGTKDLVIAEKADHVAIAQWLVNQGLDVNAEGVMAAACPATRTGRYLILEGGVEAGHACDTCKPAVPATPATKEAPEAKRPVPVPVDVLLVPQCNQ